jgi:histidine triad (HIT) family protein
MTDCVFCTIVEKNDPHHEIVWQDERHIAFLNRYPTNPGHLLVIPRAHTDYAFDLAPEAYAALLEASRALAAPLKAYTGKKRIALAIDGFHVPHVHVHLVPVEKTGDLCNASAEADPEALAVAGDALRALYTDLV